MRHIFLILIIPSLLYCQQKPKESPSEGFEKDLKYFKEYFHIPGMAAIITQNGKVTYENYFGYADLKTKRRVDSTTIFPIASVTKAFATILLMQFVESGDLDLDDPINNYLDDRTLSDSIKIKHILSHTSEGVPGSFFNYSGRFFLLTKVIEKVGGKPLNSLLKDNILKPQGLHHTFPIVDQSILDSLADNLAKPYYYYGEIEDGHYDIGISTASGIASTVRDLATFDNGITSGELISSKNKNKMFSPFNTSYGNSPYGLGIFSQEFLGKQLIWGYGQEDCFSSLLLKVPENDITLILLANNNLMSDPARLINGDITYSLFALSFLKHFLFDLPKNLEIHNWDRTQELDLTFYNNGFQSFYRQELLANALAASFIGHADNAEFTQSKELVTQALKHFPNHKDYENQTLMKLLTTLSIDAGYREFDEAIEQLGKRSLEVYKFDPYINVYLGFHYNNLQEKEKALIYFKNVVDANNFQPFWYTIEALDFLGDYYKQKDPRLARSYFQRVVDIGWNMSGKLDKANRELDKL